MIAFDQVEDISRADSECSEGACWRSRMVGGFNVPVSGGIASGFTLGDKGLIDGR